MSMSLKYPHQFCTIFGTIEHCDILNMPVTSLSSLSIDATWQKTKNSLFSYYKTDFVEPFLLPGSVQNPNVIKKSTSWTSFYHLKICLICPLFYVKCIRDMTSPFADASRLWDFVRPWCSLQIKLPSSTTLAAVQVIVDGLYLPVFQYIAAVDFVMLNSPSWRRSPSY